MIYYGSNSSEDLKNLIDNFTNNSSNNHSNSPDNSSNNSNNDDSSKFNIDFETIMKMKNIMDALNSKKDDPRSNLLQSLKPYLKEERKNKIDQYIQLLNMSNVFNMLKNTGGDKNS